VLQSAAVIRNMFQNIQASNRVGLVTGQGGEGLIDRVHLVSDEVLLFLEALLQTFNDGVFHVDCNDQFAIGKQIREVA
jgi:hypothetical protein